MSRQSRRIKVEAQAAEEVEQRMETAVKQRSRKELAITAEDIVRERDERGLSWAQVAKNLDLASPGAARSAYTKLTGRPHTESQMQGRRAPRGTGVRSTNRKTVGVQWDDDSDQDEIEQRLNGAWIEESGTGKDYTPGHWSGSTIVVARKYGEEEVRVKVVKAFTFGKNGDKPLTVELLADNAFRAFYVRDIKEVR